MEFGIRPGISATFQFKVTEKDVIFPYAKSPINHLLTTPALVGYMIAASTRVVDPILPEGFITIGTKINVKHLAPTPLGVTVTVRATLKKIQHRRMLFLVEAFDEREKIGIGLHVRYITRPDKYLTRDNSNLYSL